jgi:hypothetical protein
MKFSKTNKQCEEFFLNELNYTKVISNFNDSMLNYFIVFLGYDLSTLPVEMYEKIKRKKSRILTGLKNKGLLEKSIRGVGYSGMYITNCSIITVYTKKEV